jgi:hypothetical protein
MSIFLAILLAIFLAFFLAILAFVFHFGNSNHLESLELFSFSKYIE